MRYFKESMTSEQPKIKVLITDGPLKLLDGVRFVTSPKCGAIHTFSGTIRDTDTKTSGLASGQQKPIVGIYYEAYNPMAMEMMATIVEEILYSTIKDEQGAEVSSLNDSNSGVYLAVRIGLVPIQEPSLIICVSSTSRHFSHKATMTILERVKSQVPIWKKIYFDDGHEEWAGIAKSEADWLTQTNGQ